MHPAALYVGSAFTVGHLYDLRILVKGYQHIAFQGRIAPRNAIHRFHDVPHLFHHSAAACLPVVVVQQAPISGLAVIGALVQEPAGNGFRPSENAGKAEPRQLRGLHIGGACRRAQGVPALHLGDLYPAHAGVRSRFLYTQGHQRREQLTVTEGKMPGRVIACAYHICNFGQLLLIQAGIGLIFQQGRGIDAGRRFGVVLPHQILDLL